jgi:hypothetical protein
VTAIEWVTQFGQLSASAALTTVLGWLLWNMPKHFAEERKSRESIAVAEANSRIAVAQESASSMASLVAEFKESARYERESCERRHKELVDSDAANHRELLEASERRYTALMEKIEQVHVAVRETKHDAANIAQTLSNRVAVAQLEARKKRGEGPTTGGSSR